MLPVTSTRNRIPEHPHKWKNVYVNSVGVINDALNFQDSLKVDIQKNYKLNLINKKNSELLVRQSVNRVLKNFTNKRPKIVIQLIDEENI